MGSNSTRHVPPGIDYTDGGTIEAGADMAEYRVESMMEVLAEFKDLCVSHWMEIANYQDKIPLEPDWDKYRALENAKMLAFMSVRVSGVMVGYCAFIITPHLHYKSCVTAMNDLIYVRPEYRGFIGAKLIKESERMVTALGARRIIWHVKPGERDWSSVLERMGYSLEEMMMGKYVE
jgi:GNAT superfamily N-acetyltransferase